MPQLQGRIFTQSSLLILLVILVFACSSEAQSIAEKWSNLGPEQVHINCITVDPVDHNIVYAGTDTGVYKSTDGGQNWFNTNPNGQPNLGIYSIIVDPVINKNVYLLTHYYVIKSTDAGKSWTILHFPVFFGYEVLPTRLFIDPLDSNVVFATREDLLLKSTDGGKNWSKLQTAQANDELMLSAGISQLDHKVIYLGLRKLTKDFLSRGPNDFQDRIIISSDSGATWEELVNNTVRVLDSNEQTKINVAGMLVGTTQLGVGGLIIGDCDSYSLCQDIECAQIGSVHKSLTCSSYFSGDHVVDVSKSQGNKLALFDSYLFNLPDITCPTCPVSGNLLSYNAYLEIDPSDSNILYVKGSDSNVGQRLYKSIDGGTNWTTIGNGLNNSTVHALAVDPSRPETVFAGGSLLGVDGGISKKSEGQSAFTRINAPNTNGKDFTAIAVDPHNPNIILAGGNGIIYRSIDDGVTWGVSTDTNDPKVTYLSTVVRSIVFNSAQTNTIYAAFVTHGTVSSPGVIKTSDGGQTWTGVNSGLPSANVNTLAIDPRSPDTLYAGFDNAIYKTTDGGANWREATANNCCGVNVIAFDEAHPGTIYALGDGLQKSVDDGATWTVLLSLASKNRYNIVKQGFSWTTVGFSQIVFDPLHPDTMYVGTNTPAFRILADDHAQLFKGMFKSTNGGLSWWPVNDGLTTPFVTSLAIDRFTNKLYAGTEGGGVFVTQTAQSPKAGDVNGDGKIDVRDLTTLANGLAGNLQLDPFSADILADGQINVQDLMALAGFLAGNVSKLPIAPDNN